MSKKLFILGLTSLLVFPSVVLAISPVPIPNDVLNNQDAIWRAISNVINFLWIFFIGMAVLMFIYAGYMYLKSIGDPSKITLAKQAFLWGVIGLIVALLSTSIVLTVQSLLK